MDVCINCGKEFQISGFKKLFGNHILCPSCKAEKDKKIRRYTDAVKHFGKDKYLSQDEEEALQELKRNLESTDDDLKDASKELERLRHSTLNRNITASKAERDEKIRRYIDAVKHFGKDEYLSQDEEEALQELKQNLELTDDDLKNANKELEKLRHSTLKQNLAAFDQKAAAIASDRQISQQEEIELAEMMKSLGMSERDLPGKTQQTLSDARMLTELARGKFPVLQASILLKQKEVCHFITPAQLLEELTKIRYVGGSHGVSFRVAKGVTFRTGSFSGSPIKESFQKVTDTGTLFVTNKRVLFVGRKKNVSYPINKIIDITKYTDGIKFQKENETKPRIFMIDRQSHIDAIGLIVSALAQSY